MQQRRQQTPNQFYEGRKRNGSWISCIRLRSCSADEIRFVPTYSSYGLYEEVLSVRVCTLNDTAGDGKSMRRSAGFPGISCCWQSKI